MTAPPTSRTFDFLASTPHQRAKLNAESLKRDFAAHLRYSLSKDRFTATRRDQYVALALAVRDRVVERWIKTQQTHHEADAKRIYYLSLEYLMGRALHNNIINLGFEEVVRDALDELGISLYDLLGHGVDAGLGNGGLGRLAACFLDSMATMELPAFGYGLCYDYGIFTQSIQEGRQFEKPDDWLRSGNPWMVERPEYRVEVHFGGRVETAHGHSGMRVRWVDTDTVIGLPHDVPIVGYGCNTVNNLRLWSAKARDDFDFHDFNRGDYFGAVEEKNRAESITKVLYPNDNNYEGKALRFRQQYFFVSCSLQDIFRRFVVDNDRFDVFPERAAIQLNDTHPALAVPELMHILVDQHQVDWEEAWEITRASTGYTNHTLMPEALERWPIEFFETFLPRHLQIVHEINRRFLRCVQTRFPFDRERVRRMSLIDETEPRSVRMAHLSIVGTKSTNGVAALHTHLLQTHLFRDFFELDPEKFNSKTNGITPRRWLLLSNPGLSELISDRIGTEWVTNLDLLRQIESATDDSEFRAAFRGIKAANKARLSDLIRQATGTCVPSDAVFDVQVKRLHEYKRQLLNLLHIIHLYLRMKQDRSWSPPPRVFVFAGKAAPGYAMAKLIIKAIHCVADVVNHDDTIGEKLRVVFLPNYGVSLAQVIIPAADISQQISTAGMEASGTGNMKFALNGALTIGTLDGANIEIREEVGDDNIFTFGHTADQVEMLRVDPERHPRTFYETDDGIRQICDLLFDDFFNRDEPGIFRSIQDRILNSLDPYVHLADFAAYRDAMQRTYEQYEDPDGWTRSAILNVARVGKFSSDRTIKEYNDDIWHVKPIPIKV
ncbi:MAG: glycogen phosphorylase [Gemmatimonadetes bacterium]|nr:glycogen phosphorylase [Gemmatimonadota bacterium]